MHSVLIGMTLGVQPEYGTVASLFTVLSFHQFFEGMALGASLMDANIQSRLHLSIMVMIFVLTTPIGIVVGILISSTYNPDSPTSKGVEGTFDALSSGVLIYMALVDLIADDFHKPENQKYIVQMLISIFLGAAGMAIIALWA